MESIRLKNYRCFDDTGEINIKPLNFVVGSNSSGKSSFLKFFPLLKQSIGKRLHGVFMWLGDEVDFKDFKNTAKLGRDRIEIAFTISDMRVLRMRRSYSHNGFSHVKVKFGIEAVGEHFDQIADIAISLDEKDCIEIDFRNSYVNVKINGKQHEEKNVKLHKVWTNSLFPSLLLEETEMGNDYENLRNRFVKKLGTCGIDGFRAIQFIGNLPMSYEKFKERFSKKNISDEGLQSLYEDGLYITLDNILDSINAYLMNLRNNIVYVKPIRAMFQRYYRYQNVDMDAIESDGSNLPMFLNNQPTQIQKQFRNWLKENFDIDVYVEPHDTHMELMISDHGKNPHNLVDVGVGFTQILPILAIIWEKVYLRIPRSEKDIYETIMVIEQPELYLHPAFQRRFAHMLVSMLTTFEKEGKDVRFIIETHSETILNEIGNIISTDQELQPLVNVLLTQQDNTGNSSIIKTEYTSDGFLKNWPINFF